MVEQEKKTIEVRGFMQLVTLFKERNWPNPLIIDLEEPATGTGLAERLEIPLDDVEIIFVNGWAQDISYTINPGDRVAFVPPGCPGPHRYYLGFVTKNKRRLQGEQ
jgi:hypothetical protein